MIIVARHQEGIGLNPLEYLLNEDGTEKEFESKESAIEFLKEAGASNEDGTEKEFESKESAIEFLKEAGASNEDIYFLKFLDAKTGEEL